MASNISTPSAPIGVFDSGFGGLSILREIRKVLPQYDYIFLGDNARAPYGNRSYQLVYEFTLQAVKHLFNQGCQLVILACNTASAKALRSIQQRDLAGIDPNRRVLGVIRPTVEEIGNLTTTRNVGIFGTPGTVQSLSYDIEIGKMFPDIKVYSHACPMWVPLVENRESDGPGADYFVKKDVDSLMSQCADIDAIILGCTHYPLLCEKIKKYVPAHVKIIEQGPIVAHSLKDYLDRHPEMEQRCSKGGSCRYTTTEDASRFSPVASIFVNHTVNAEHVIL
ncbi:MAG: glutamate racemase [Muribaculaceae bacterium]|nr:glutamate racemase [Muribaculaceae bacterium]MBQ3910720.1 glutamate racemase [Muribaculaceae bacterium]MBQ6647436.1 glutamate racemase [Muribaculaceae bacterium]